jgi:hypothetical protein
LQLLLPLPLAATTALGLRAPFFTAFESILFQRAAPVRGEGVALLAGAITVMVKAEGEPGVQPDAMT